MVNHPWEKSASTVFRQKYEIRFRDRQGFFPRPPCFVEREETSFLGDKLNQPEISGDLMSGKKCEKVKYLNKKFESEKKPRHFWWIGLKCIKGIEDSLVWRKKKCRNTFKMYLDFKIFDGVFIVKNWQ